MVGDSGEAGRERPPPIRAGWAIAALLFALLGTGAYAATGVAYDLFREELPGEDGRRVGEEIGQTETANGARVTLEYAYADAKYVVVGFSVEDLQKDRNIGGRPSQLVPAMLGDARGHGGKLSPHVGLTDEDGLRFHMEGGSTSLAAVPKERRTPKPHTAIFEAPGGLKPGEEHRFRLTVALEEQGIRRTGEGSVLGDPDPGVGPFVFGFEVPVRPVPVVEVDQEVEAKGVTLTLKEVVNSPGRPQAIFCFEPPPGDGWGYYPVLAREDGGESGDTDQIKDNCWSMMMGDIKKGRSTVTVAHLAYLEGEAGKTPVYPRELTGPWTFEFDAPAP